MKRYNNNCEDMDGNEQSSSTVNEAPNPKVTKCNSIAKVRKSDDTYFRYGFFSQNLNVEDTFQNARTTESLTFLFFNFCNNC